MDGCPGLIFHQTENGEFYQNEKRLSTAFLYGQATTHGELYASHKSQMVGVFFYPHALSSIFGLQANELTNDCINLDCLPLSRKSHLVYKLLAAASVDAQVDILSTYLLKEIQANSRHIDKTVEQALSLIIKSDGTISLSDLRSILQVSERSFERKFKQAVGVAPKLFSRICRFQASLRQLRNNKFNKLSDIAFDREYSDQSHFIRTFKQFAGFSPIQYQKQSVEVGENLLRL